MNKHYEAIKECYIEQILDLNQNLYRSDLTCLDVDTLDRMLTRLIEQNERE